MPKAPDHIVISRTDSIGDVMLTLPMAGLLKHHFPGVWITFIGRSYTSPILQRCAHVDRVLTLEELAAVDGAVALKELHADALVHVFPRREIARWAKAAGIPMRIGTSHRWWHWLGCTHRVAFSRRRSLLHEAQLNLKLLRPLMEVPDASPDQLAKWSGFAPPPPDDRLRSWLAADRCTVILHPGSKGSAAEWGLAHFASLIRLLSAGPFTVIVTGTAAEAEHYRSTLPLDLPGVIDAGGVLDLPALVALIGASDALVAASTGPLHIAAACGIRAIGLYAPRRPIHPGRWAPIGRDAHALVHDPACADCAAGRSCACIQRIGAHRVMALLEGLPRR